MLKIFIATTILVSAISPVYAQSRSSNLGAPMAIRSITPSLGHGFNRIVKPANPIKPIPYFPGFTGRKKYYDNNGVKNIVEYENGKVVAVYQVL